MTNNTDRILQAIAALEAQRGLIDDAIIDTSIASLRQQLPTTISTPNQQRKQVTILFAALGNLDTQLTQLDAEDASSYLNTLWQTLDDIIRQFNGYIDKHIGHTVMALWGVDQAREDDPEQAVRAALALRTAVQLDISTPLPIQIGINTGLVMLGTVGSSNEYTAIGDPVNVAARLQQTVPWNKIRISQETYQHVRGIFAMERQEPVTLKGKSEPVTTYHVTKIRPRAYRYRTRGVEGIKTRLIGRDDELNQLRQAYHTAHKQHQTQLLTISAEAGLGKSRLLQAFDDWVETLPHTTWHFKGRATPQTQTIPYYLLRDIFTTRFQILDSDNLTTVRHKLEQGLINFDITQPVMKAHILGAWLGYDFWDSPHTTNLHHDPAQLHNQALQYLIDFFVTIANTHPIGLLLEDIHWADIDSLNAVRTLCQRAPNLPLIIISLTRPEFWPENSHWGQWLANNHTRIDLTPLSPNASQALIREILQKIDGIPAELIALITERAEGNPFYVEELIKMLIDDGLIITTGEKWSLKQTQLPTSRIPTTLTGVLQSRLDRLPNEEQMTIEQAAVIGRTFWAEAVATLGGNQNTLTNLQNKELVYAQNDTSFAQTQEYIFKHALLRDVTYGRVLRRQRQKYHFQTAKWLEQVTAQNQRQIEYALTIAEHYEQTDTPHQARPWYQKAIQQAMAQYSYENALPWLERALELTPDNEHSQRAQLLRQQNSIFNHQGQRQRQKEVLDQLLTLSPHLDAKTQVQIQLLQSDYYEANNEYDLALQSAQLARQQATNLSDHQLMADAYQTEAHAIWRQEDHQSAQQVYKQALFHAQQSQQPRLIADSHFGYALAVGYMAQYELAEQHLHQALTLYQQIEDKFGQSRCYNAFGASALEQGNHQEAQTFLEKCLRLKRETGERRGIAVCLHNLGRAYMHHGQYEAFHEAHVEAFAIAQEINELVAIRLYASELAYIATIFGQYHSAHQYLDKATAITQIVDYPIEYAFNHYDLGRLALAEEEWDTAYHHLTTSLTYYDQIERPRDRANIIYHLGQWAYATKQWPQAIDYWQEILPVRQKSGNVQTTTAVHAALAATYAHNQQPNLAHQHLTPALDYLQTNSVLAGLRNPFPTYIYLAQALEALNDERADQIWALAYRQLNHLAQQIKNPDRQMSFLYKNNRHQLIREKQKDAR
ncbi:MAG TPA: adenylate/guanylate cyclase domain-containing protein [Anaerolineae bacterium]|nr:adenylate/guanylate cyclase domain-containing protein [Anaerolineae bacterium]